MSSNTTEENARTAEEAAADKRRWTILFLALIAQFIVVLDATIVTVALPSIQTHLGFSSQLNLQWVINAYSLFFGGFLLLGGRAGDLLGRQRLFIVGLALFTLASLANGLAQSPNMLIVGRGVQGLGGALVSPAVLSIIIVTFTSAAERTKALGYFTAVTASGAAAGMLAGGALTDALSWRSIFLVNVPIGIVGIIGAIRLIPNSKVADGGFRNMDLPGAVSVTGGLTLLVYTIVNANSWGWTSGRSLGLFAASAVLLVGFVVIESRTRNPLVRLKIFANRSLAVANGAMFLMMAGLFTTMFFPTLYLAENKGFSPIEIGLAYLPWPVTMAVTSGIGQKLTGRIGLRAILVLGMLFVAGGLFWFAQLPTDGGYASAILPGLILTAVGGGLSWGTLFGVATMGVSAEESGLASGLINTSQQIGSALGLAVLSAIAANRTSSILDRAGSAASDSLRDSALVDGFQRGFMIGAFIVCAGAVVLALGLGKDLGRTPAGGTPDQEKAEAPQKLVPATGN